MKLLLLVAVVFILAIFALWIWNRSRWPRIGEIAPAGVLQKKYGLYAENRPIIHINPADVLESLRDLIPMAEKWGIGDDIIRYDFEQKTGRHEKDEFQQRLRGRTAEVSAWLDSLGAKSPMSDAAAAFMYMLTALDETGLWPD